MEKTEEEVIWSRSNSSLFEDFAISLEEYTKTGKAPSEGDWDIQYGLELQDKRLQKKGLAMEYKFIPRGHLPKNPENNRSWSDEHYISTLWWRRCRRERSLYRGTKNEYEDKENMSFCQIITDVNGPGLIVRDVYNCPNCGAAVTIGELQKGCPYCSAHFEISDIFPSVSNYYFLKDPYMTDKEQKAYRAKYMIGCAVLVLLYGTFYHYFYGGAAAGSFIFSMLSTVFVSIFGGVIGGYFVSSVALLGKLMREAGKELVLLPSMGTGGHFSRKMKKYSPEFSYEYFSNKMVSLIKMIIFSDVPSDLPVYIGKPLGGLFENVVDVSYTGVLGFRSLTVKGDYCSVSVDVFLDNLYDNGKRIFQRREKYRVWVKKNINKPINMHFSIRHLQCKGCGMSFDAAKEKHCPACGTAYDLENEDWVVTRMEKKIY